MCVQMKINCEKFCCWAGVSKRVLPVWHLIYFACNAVTLVLFPPALLIDVLRGDRSLEQKMKFLRENRFLQ